MRVGFSKHKQAADGHDPTVYPLSPMIEKSFGNRREVFVRNPEPELLLGSPTAVVAAIRELNLQNRYRAAVMTFAGSDLDPIAFNSGCTTARRAVAAAVELFLELGFAGVPRDNRLPYIVGTHTHVPGQLEINILVIHAIRNAKGHVRSFNIHPPTRGSEKDIEAFEDLLNLHFGWADPRCPSRAARIKLPDYLHKEVAEAERHGVTFDTSQPKLFLAQSLLRLGNGPAADFEAGLSGVLEACGYMRLKQSATSLIVGPEAGRARDTVALRGRYVDGAGPATNEEIAERKAELRTAPERFHVAWHKRAAENRATFGDDTWDLKAPDIDSVVERPNLNLPACHHNTYAPGFPPGGSQPARSRKSKKKKKRTEVVTLATRLNAALGQIHSHMKAGLTHLFDLTAMSRLLRAKPFPDFAKHIRKMENLNDRANQIGSRPESGDQVDQGTFRSDRRAAETKGGQRAEQPDGRTHNPDAYLVGGADKMDGNAGRHSVGRGEGDTVGSTAGGPDVNGTAHAGRPVASGQGLDGADAPRLIDFVRAVRRAAGTVFPREDVVVRLKDAEAWKIELLVDARPVADVGLNGVGCLAPDFADACDMIRDNLLDWLEEQPNVTTQVYDAFSGHVISDAAITPDWAP
ncbi:hypothetical protein O4H61_19335 [Roseovarius aestuarii]|nr:hypothetical protein [Roseovarius aestuarii]